MSVDFAINSYTIDPAYGDNEASICKLNDLFAGLLADPAVSIDSVKVSGYASPDGLLPKNKELSLRRALAISDHLKTQCRVPDSLIRLGRNEVSWTAFRTLIQKSDYAWRDRALRLMAAGSDASAADNTRRMNGLKRLDGGRAWAAIKTDILPRLRCAVVITTSVTVSEPAVPEPASEDAPMAGEAMPADADADADTTSYYIIEETPVAAPTASDTPAGRRSWRVYSNAIEWGLLIANAGGEWDFSDCWSLNLSLHYSALNYFSARRKFRTFILRPEVRFWPAGQDRGLFVDAHVQMAAYNFALRRWAYRIQDVDGKHPALGGGIGVGYRLPLGRSGHWAAEAALGVGVYRLRYDRFENRPGGQLVDTRSRTRVCIDNVALSIVYKFKTAAAR